MHAHWWSLNTYATACLFGLLTIYSAGCSLRANSKVAAAPAPPKPAIVPRVDPPVNNVPSEPLSIPQIHVQLPSPQPLNPVALAATPDPVPPPPPMHVRVPRPLRNPPLAPPVAVPPPPEAVPEERPRIQTIVPAEEVRRIQETIDARKREINERLSQAQRRSTDDAEKNVLARIQSFVSLSDEAARRGDMTQADALSERALVLARELQVAK